MAFSPKLQIDRKVLYQIVCLVKGRYIFTKLFNAYRIDASTKDCFCLYRNISKILFHLSWVHAILSAAAKSGHSPLNGKLFLDDRL